MKNFFISMYEGAKAFYLEHSELVTIIAIGVVALILFLILNRKSSKKTFNTRSIVYASVSIATATILNYFVIFTMPQGGSVTLFRVLPLLIYAYIFGAKRGFIVGAIYGIIDFIAKPYLFHPVQFILDYPLAFSTVGFVGIFGNNKLKMRNFSFILGTVIFGFARFSCSTIAGYLYLNTPFWGSAAYNSMILIDTAVALVGVIILLCSKSFQGIVDRAKI